MSVFHYVPRVPHTKMEHLEQCAVLKKVYTFEG